MNENKISFQFENQLSLGILGNTITKELKLQNIKFATGLDIPIWRAEQNGDFSTFSVWHYTYEHKEKVEWTKWIWHTLLLQKIYTLMWRGLNIGLPFEQNIVNNGFKI